MSAEYPTAEAALVAAGQRIDALEKELATVYANMTNAQESATRYILELQSLRPEVKRLKAILAERAIFWAAATVEHRASAPTMLPPPNQTDAVSVPGEERREFEALHAFQLAMWEKLKRNRHKGSWKTDPFTIFRRMLDECYEVAKTFRVAELSGENGARSLSADVVRTRFNSGLDLLSGAISAFSLTTSRYVGTSNPEATRAECADVANFAMMTFDVLGTEPKT